jgi:hypothetical protein
LLTEQLVESALPPESASFVRAYVSYARQRNCAPLAYHLGVALTTLASTCPPDYGGWYVDTQRSNLFVMAVGRSGDDYKSTAVNLGRNLLFCADPKRVIQNAETKEKMAEVLCATPIGMITYSELGIFLKNSEKGGYGEGLKTAFNVLWEWLPAFPPEAERQHKPDALVACYAARTYPSIPVFSRGSMDPKLIFEKLGIAEGVKPEEAAAALIKYLAGPDSDADKQALVLGLLSMLVPAPAPSAGSMDDSKDVAIEAMVEEMRKLQARVVELEGAKMEAEKKAEPTPEMRADAAIRSGQWPESGRASLVRRFAENKPVHLFAEKTFLTRSANVTSGGNPVGRAPNFGGANPDAAKPAANGGAKSIFDEVAARLGRSNGTS